MSLLVKKGDDSMMLMLGYRGNDSLMEALEIVENLQSENIDLQAELDVARV
jgi:hypothetical protein